MESGKSNHDINLEMQRKDHDTLIRVETLLTTVANDVKEMTNYFRTQMTDHDVRIKSIEKTLDQHSLTDLSTQTTSNSAWIRDFKTTYRVVVVMAGFTGAAVMWTISFVTKFFGIAK